jgi:hypothetical protein
MSYPEIVLENKLYLKQKLSSRDAFLGTEFVPETDPLRQKLSSKKRRTLKQKLFLKQTLSWKQKLSLKQIP